MHHKSPMVLCGECTTPYLIMYAQLLAIFVTLLAPFLPPIFFFIAVSSLYSHYPAMAASEFIALLHSV